MAGSVDPEGHDHGNRDTDQKAPESESDEADIRHTGPWAGSETARQIFSIRISPSTDRMRRESADQIA